MQSAESQYKEIIDAFELKPDDCVFLSSDINRLARNYKISGRVFNADVFIDSLKENLSIGTLIIPAYTDNLKNGETFNREKSKPTTGALSNRVFRRNDFQRSSDPLHSVFVWGKHAKEILELKDVSTFGPKSIFGFLEKVNAKMIIIDVHFQNSFTFVHYIEERRKVLFRRPYNWKMKVIKNGIESEEDLVFYTKKPGYLVDLNDLQEKLIENRIVIEKEIFGCPIMIMELETTGKAVEEYMNEGGKTYSFDLKVWGKQIVKKIIGKK